MRHHVQKVVDHLYGPTGSVILHIVLVIVLVKFVSFAKKGEAPEVEVMIMEAHSVDLEELEKLEQELDDIQPPEIDIQVDVYQDVPAPETPDAMETAEPDVDLSALDISDAASPLIMKGLFSGRSAEGRAGRLRLYGGNAKTEGAVLGALRWLKKEQKEDGRWDKSPVAMTGLGLLTFLAHGETPASDEFGPTVEKAIKYLLSTQKESGYFGAPGGSGPPVYSHAIATYSISEAYGMTRIPALKAAMEGGVDIIIKGQQTGGGWDYGYKKGDRRDTSVCGWHVQALKAAKLSGAENPGLDKALKLATQDFKAAYHPGSKKFTYTDGPGSMSMVGAGVLGLQFLGQAKSPEVRGGMETLKDVVFSWDPTEHKMGSPMYGWYYITQAKFHKGGETWAKWNKMFAPVMVKNQASDGHWDFPKTGGKNGHEHGANTGPVYSTTLGALMLQVYYRNLPTFQEDASRAEEIQVDEIVEEEIEII